MSAYKFFTCFVGVSAGAMSLPGAASAGSLGSDQGLPFFGRPYPYGYVYHRPPAECYEIQPVETPDGPKLLLTWICGGGSRVTARY